MQWLSDPRFNTQYWERRKPHKTPYPNRFKRHLQALSTLGGYEINNSFLTKEMRCFSVVDSEYLVLNVWFRSSLCQSSLWCPWIVHLPFSETKFAWLQNRDDESIYSAVPLLGSIWGNLGEVHSMLYSASVETHCWEADISVRVPFSRADVSNRRNVGVLTTVG